MERSIGNVSWTREEQIEALKEFSELYEKRPIKSNFGGMDSAHMFHVWFIVRFLKPQFIIESGIWKGQSTWLLEEAAPEASLFCIDPDLYLREYASYKAKYQEKDFNDTDWNEILDPEQTLCFFDDHYGVDRIFQASDKGVKKIIYEDNYHDDRGNSYNPAGQCLSPKAVMREFNGADSQPLIDKTKIYYECPPIYFNDSNDRNHTWAKTTPSQFRLMTPEAMLTDSSLYPTFFEERASYTWIAYMELV